MQRRTVCHHIHIAAFEQGQGPFSEKPMKLLARVRLETKRAEFDNLFHGNHYSRFNASQTAELANQAQLHPIWSGAAFSSLPGVFGEKCPLHSSMLSTPLLGLVPQELSAFTFWGRLELGAWDLPRRDLSFLIR